MLKRKIDTQKKNQDQQNPLNQLKNLINPDQKVEDEDSEQADEFEEEEQQEEDEEEEIQHEVVCWADVDEEKDFEFFAMQENEGQADQEEEV